MADESGGVTSLAALTDVNLNLGTLSNGDILTYDIANTEWVNSGLSLTPAALEYFSYRTTVTPGQFAAAATGTFGISSAAPLFALPTNGGTGQFDSSSSSGIISIIDTFRIQLLKTGKY